MFYIISHPLIKYYLFCTRYVDKMLPNIKFTTELEQDNKLNFLHFTISSILVWSLSPFIMVMYTLYNINLAIYDNMFHRLISIGSFDNNFNNELFIIYK